MQTINVDPGRIWIKTEHGEAELLYRIDGDVMSMYHTFTPPRDRGKGTAGKLAEKAFSMAIERGLKVSPDCNYIKLFIEHNRKYAQYIVKQ